MSEPSADEVLALNQKLLDAIASGDWKTYAQLCDESITCFEPEARGHLVEGMAFHRYYFDLGALRDPRVTTMSSPHVRMLGAAAIVSYVRLVQRLDEHGTPHTTHTEETRVWQLKQGEWRHVHFHRSPCD